MLWRGNLIHGGGFDNKEKNGAMRLHLYIPMVEYSVGTLHGSYIPMVSREDEVVKNLNLNESFSPYDG